jgi:hypothetical protein
MTHKFSQIGIIFFALVVVLICCKQKPVSADKVRFAPADFPSIADTLSNLKIEWGNGERKLSHDVYFAEYGRIRRIAGDTLAMVYHFGSKGNEWDNIALRKSTDNGKSWSHVKTVVADVWPKRYSGFSTPELLVLQNKWLLLAYTGRGVPDDSLHNNLQFRISKDRGATWSKESIVAIGRSWEPGMVQLPDGEIQLFFANELISNQAAKGRHEQKILLCTSRNNGQTWSKPKMIAFIPKVRDGMPVPLLLKNNKGVVVAMESVENHHSPELVWTSIAAKWNYEKIADLDNGRRWYGSIDPIWGGGPYLVQMPTGETIIAMQTEGGRKIDRYKGWKKNTVVVMTGNSVAKNFSNPTFPYPNLPLHEGRYFCSLFVKDKNTIVLISTRNGKDGRSSLYWKEGTVKRGVAR